MADGRQAEVGQQVDPATVVVLVDGIPLPVAPDLVHYLLYKPVGVISTASDPQGRKAVVSLVPDEPRVFPVGRLDADSEGLLILTNDGALTDLLTHPRFGVTKTYVVMVDGRPSKPYDACSMASCSTTGRLDRRLSRSLTRTRVQLCWNWS